MSIVLPTPIYTRKFHIENYSKTTGIAATTWYEAFEDEDVEIIAVYYKQDNTDNAGKDMQMRLTIDGEIMAQGSTTVPDNTPVYLSPYYCGGAVPDVGDNPLLETTTTNILFGLDYMNVAAAVHYKWPFAGHSVKLEYYFDAIGANQEFHMDIYYMKKEVT